MSADGVFVMLHRIRTACMTAFAGAWHRKERSHMDALNEFDPLISRYLDGSIPPDELTALESKIISDEKFVLEFSRGCLLHRQIAELLKEDNLHQLMEQFATGTPLPKAVLDQVAAVNTLRNSSSIERSSQNSGRRRAPGLPISSGRGFCSLARRPRW